VLTGLHALVYAEDAEAARAFFADVLRWPAVDAGGGWLIFGTGPSELGVHPGSPPPGGRSHEIALMCDDLDVTMAELAARGATFGPVGQAGFGRTVDLEVPGAGTMLLYQPRHPTALGT
jgi:predicted enzyme related to lactoylglutathione lyase